MTECWKHLIEVPVEILNSFIRSTNDSKKLATGIQLFGLVLANNIDNFLYPTELSSLDFFKSLMINMKDSSKTIHASAAEVVGMLLKNIDIKKQISLDTESFSELIAYLFEILRDLDESMFITCIHRIQINYPCISERFMSKLVFHLPSLYGEFKQMCAESILSSIKVLEDPLFKTKAFMEMISHRESSLQLICLKMIYELLDKQTEEELCRLLPLICEFKNHPNVACRFQMLKTLILIYETNQLKINDSISSNSMKIKSLTNETLLITLLDEDQTIRKYNNFPYFLLYIIDPN
jgi:DNA-dependent protein kinase catalytic subunit